MHSTHYRQHTSLFIKSLLSGCVPDAYITPLIKSRVWTPATSDILIGVDAGDLSAMLLLDLSQAHSFASPGALLWHNWFGASMVPVLSGPPSLSELVLLLLHR